LRRETWPVAVSSVITERPLTHATTWLPIASRDRTRPVRVRDPTVVQVAAETRTSWTPWGAGTSATIWAPFVATAVGAAPSIATQRRVRVRRSHDSTAAVAPRGGDTRVPIACGSRSGTTASAGHRAASRAAPGAPGIVVALIDPAGT
jgi:hypothetical protein